MANGPTILSIAAGVAEGLQLLFGNSSDSVAVFQAGSTTQLFPNARPMKDNVKEPSKTMYHPVETGVLIPDHRIILQKEIDIQFIIPFSYWTSVYQQIRALYTNATLLTVKTKLATYNNMIIENIPHDEVPEIFDAVSMNIHFVEVLFVSALVQPGQPANYSPANPAASNTSQNGFQSPGTPTTTAAQNSSLISNFQSNVAHLSGGLL